jgi:hypothetical protein
VVALQGRGQRVRGNCFGIEIKADLSGKGLHEVVEEGRRTSA